ncbi:hypothetical protein GB931_05425 [Modestobacter sp. I12A-02628]|uniref:Uncharacterized protein n=1 Tax=Goekera deserti TaxID=2497753 RepID=A0A7K3WBM2_9ACTN|nr:hypothetical protein [Goekera deserti]MPQ97373.1 hypothetical protein [Goekera deserti]NDI48026.1 hypothetical protein [Goekera deserti]NEL53774.1 hypothetical protein [Goekera deserti]
MLRRLSLAVLLAVGVVLVPGSASAAPQPPPSADTYTSYYGYASVALSDGRTAQVSLSRYRAGVRDPWRGFLYVVTTGACGSAWCPLVTGSLELTGDQVRVDRQLQSASVTGVALPLGAAYLPGQPVGAPVTVTASLTFTGVGALTRDTYGGKVCGSGEPCLHSLRVDASRAATAQLTLGTLTGSGDGALTRGWSLDVQRPIVVPA